MTVSLEMPLFRCLECGRHYSDPGLVEAMEDGEGCLECGGYDFDLNSGEIEETDCA